MPITVLPHLSTILHNNSSVREALAEQTMSTLDLVELGRSHRDSDDSLRILHCPSSLSKVKKGCAGQKRPCPRGQAHHTSDRSGAPRLNCLRQNHRRSLANSTENWLPKFFCGFGVFAVGPKKSFRYFHCSYPFLPLHIFYHRLYRASCRQQAELT